MPQKKRMVHFAKYSSVTQQPDRDIAAAPGGSTSVQAVQQKIQHGIEAARKDVLQLYEYLGMPSGSEIPALWYYPLLAQDPDFAQHHFEPDMSYDTDNWDGLLYVLSDGVTPRDSAAFAREVLRDSKLRESDFAYHRIQDRLTEALCNSGHSDTLRELFKEGLLNQNAAVQAAITSLDCQYDETILEKGFFTLARSLIRATDLSETIKKAWDYLFWNSDYSSSRTFAAIVALADHGLPDADILGEFERRLQHLEYLTPVEVVIPYADKFRSVTNTSSVPIEMRFSLKAAERLVALLEKEGLALASEVPLQVVKDLRATPFSSPEHSHNFPLVVTEAIRKILEAASSRGRLAITKQCFAEIYGVEGDRILPHEMAGAYLLMTLESHGIVDQLRVSKRAFAEFLDGAEIFLRLFDDPTTLSYPHRLLHYFWTDIEYSPHTVRRFASHCREACQQAIGVFKEECQNWRGFLAVLQALPIPGEEKRELIQLLMHQEGKKLATWYIDIPDLKDFAMLRQALDIYYQPVAEARGSLQALHEREGLKTTLPPSFTHLMKDDLSRSAVPPSDQRGWARALARLFREILEDDDESTTELRRLNLAPSSMDAIASLSREQKSIRPYRSQESSKETIGELSRPLTAENRYLVTALCPHYSMRTLEYLAVGESVAHAKQDQEISAFLKKRSFSGSSTREPPLAITLHQSSYHAALPVPALTDPSSVELLSRGAKISYDRDGLPYLLESADALTYLATPVQAALKIPEVTVKEYRSSFDNKARKALCQAAVPISDLIEPVRQWIASVAPKDPLPERINELIKIVGAHYLYDKEVGKNSEYVEILDAQRPKKPKQDDYLRAMHAAAREPYAGTTVCGGAAHIVLQALRHAQIPVLMGRGYLLSEGSREFSQEDAHAFPVLLASLPSGEVYTIPIEATQYMSRSVSASSSSAPVALSLSTTSRAPANKTVISHSQQRARIEFGIRSNAAEATAAASRIRSALAERAETQSGALLAARRLAAPKVDPFQDIVELSEALASPSGLRLLKQLLAEDLVDAPGSKVLRAIHKHNAKLMREFLRNLKNLDS